MLNGIFEFAFKGGKEKHIDLSRNKAFGVIKKRIHIFTGNSLQREVRYPIKRYYFEVRNLNMLQTTGISVGIKRIPVGIKPAPSQTNLYLSKDEYDFMAS